MTARITKKGISVTNILNESLLERLSSMVEEAGAIVSFKDYMTKALVTGDRPELNKFIELWNSNR